MEPGHLCNKDTNSGIATPGHTRAQVKFTGALVKILWKAKVKDHLLASVTAFT